MSNQKKELALQKMEVEILSTLKLDEHFINKYSEDPKTPIIIKSALKYALGRIYLVGGI